MFNPDIVTPDRQYDGGSASSRELTIHYADSAFFGSDSALIPKYLRFVGLDVAFTEAEEGLGAESTLTQGFFSVADRRASFLIFQTSQNLEPVNPSTIAPFTEIASDTVRHWPFVNSTSNSGAVHYACDVEIDEIQGAEDVDLAFKTLRAYLFNDHREIVESTPVNTESA